MIFREWRLQAAQRRLAGLQAEHAELNRFVGTAFETGAKVAGYAVEQLARPKGRIGETEKLIEQLGGRDAIPT